MTPQELITDLTVVGGFGLAHLGIIANRRAIRPFLNSRRYNQISLQLEHIVHHATVTLAAGVLFKYMNYDPNIVPSMAVFASSIKGVYQDAIHPIIPQLDQLTSDIVGTGVGYAAFSSLY